MPYALVPPKAGRSPYWRVRGTEYGISVDRSTRVIDKASAGKLLKQWKDEAKRQHLAPAPDDGGSVTFASAAVSYIQAGRSKLFVRPLLLHFRETPLAKIGQAEIDAAAAVILPNALPQTRNRSVYTPVLAIMRHAGVVKSIRRPKWTGGKRLDWLRPDEAHKLLEAAGEVDERLGALMTFLLYAGPRLSEALRLTWTDVDLSRSTALLRHTKNGESMTVHIPPAAVAALSILDKRKRRVFGLSKCARLYALLDKAEKLSGVTLPPRSAFHTLRHSHAMWRRLFAGADTSALVASGLWKSRNAASVYEHLDLSAESRKSDLFPAPPRTTRAKAVR
jgi:integrase